MEQVVCRICLSEVGEFQTVFTSVDLKENNTTIHLSEMICSFAQVQITLGDGLPEQICKSCANITIQMYFFKIRCEESDTFLRKKLIDKHTGKFTKENLPTMLDDIDHDFSNFNCDYENSFSEDDGLNEDIYEPSAQAGKPEKIKEFSCNICHKRFSREDLLLRHKIAHAMKMQDFKDKVEENEDSYSEHDEPKKPENGIVKIDNTSAKDDPVNTCTMKSDGIELEMNNKCLLCNYGSTNEEGLEKHLYDHLKVVMKENNQLLTCKVCNINIKDVSFFKKHIKKKHCRIKSNKKYSCPCCFMEYTKIGYFRKHMASHESNESEEELQNEDDDGPAYACDHCDKVFRSKGGRRKHLSKVGLLTKKITFKKKPHVCEICLKAFNQLSNLKDHLRTHNGEKPFLCPTCGKGFNQLGNLRQHQVRHSGVKSHVCTTCGHGFASKGELHAHLRKHTGAKPFVCDACGHGFTTSSSLTKHKRIHSGEKPYECDYCKMKFSRSGILSRHKRIHTGEKPYVCKICSKAFTQSNDLNSHLRIHTGEKPYKCDQCGLPFRQNSALRSHRRTHLEPKPQHLRPILPKKERDVFVEDEEQFFVKLEDLSATVKL